MSDLPFGHRPASVRVATGCDTCGGVDDHPKHHVGDPVAGRIESHHHDCGAAAGCAVCAVIEDEAGGKRHAALSRHLSGNTALAAAVARRLHADTPDTQEG